MMTRESLSSEEFQTRVKKLHDIVHAFEDTLATANAEQHRILEEVLRVVDTDKINQLLQSLQAHDQQT